MMLVGGGGGCNFVVRVVPCLGYFFTIDSEFIGVVFKDFPLFLDLWNMIFCQEKS